MQQQLQFLRSQTNACSVAGRPAESPALETFCADPQPAAVPYQQFHSVSRLIREYENVAALRILSEDCLYVRIEPVETAPHIYRSKCHNHAGCRRKAEHYASVSTRIRSLVGSTSRQRTVTPERPTYSIVHPEDDGIIECGSLISLKTMGAGN